jgi:hypothetical protein
MTDAIRKVGVPALFPRASPTNTGLHQHLVLLGLSVKVIFLSLFQTYFVEHSVYEEWLCLLVTIL